MDVVKAALPGWRTVLTIGASMRTQDEIIARIEERKNCDPLGFEVPHYIYYLDYEHAKPYLKDNVTAESWAESIETNDVHELMKEYMEFAWEKAFNGRGISAGRSISHYIAWLWIAGDNELYNEIENYENYGIPQLIQICKYLGIPIPS